MDRIHRLPFITGGCMAALTGIISYACGSDSQTTYLRMAMVMVLFYIIGVFIRNTVKSINGELEEKKQQELLKEQEAAEAEAVAQAAARQHAGDYKPKVNLVADDSDEEFQPMTVSRVISTKMKE